MLTIKYRRHGATAHHFTPELCSSASAAEVLRAMLASGAYASAETVCVAVALRTIRMSK